MSALKCNAIVLRYADYREADRMLTLFSRQEGKLAASVRGVKKQTSKLRYCAEVFHFGEYLLNESKGRYTVIGCTSLDTYYPVRNDLERLWCATLAANMVEVVINAQPDPALFDALQRTLFLLAYDDCDYMAILDAFLMEFLHCNGIFPLVQYCGSCGEKNDLFFSSSSGGTICKSCFEKIGGIRLSQSALSCLVQGGLGQPLPVLCQCTKETRSELFNILVNHAQYCLDRHFKIAEYLYKL